MYLYFLFFKINIKNAIMECQEVLLNSSIIYTPSNYMYCIVYIFNNTTKKKKKKKKKKRCFKHYSK